MEKMQRKVEEFMKAAGQEFSARPAIPDEATRDLRIRVMREELLGSAKIYPDPKTPWDNPHGLIVDKSDELVQSMLNNDLVGVADGIADMLYVLLGTASVYGIDAEQAFNEAHRSNMTKFVEDPETHELVALTDEGGKVIKPDSYEPADFDKVISILNLCDCREESNGVTHAKAEMKRAGLDDHDVYGDLIFKAVVELMEVFASQGHSGYSAMMVLSLMDSLGDFKNLTPLTDDPDEWEQHDRGMWQNKRNSSAFSDDEGRSYYLLNELSTWNRADDSTPLYRDKRYYLTEQVRFKTPTTSPLTNPTTIEYDVPESNETKEK